MTTEHRPSSEGNGKRYGAWWIAIRAGFAFLAILALALGMAACYFPARRAMRLDPAVALRGE